MKSSRRSPYSDDDLNYNVSDCRANREQNDPDARPAVDGTVENMDGYDVIFLGYPIWWGEAPRIISTFLESYDFSGKTIVPFCTSASSAWAGARKTWRLWPRTPPGWRAPALPPATSQEEVAAWVDGLGL